LPEVSKKLNRNIASLKDIFEHAWTPSGMLSMNLTNYVDIDGLVFDDWDVEPKLVK
jgi:hypothetical protein